MGVHDCVKVFDLDISYCSIAKGIQLIESVKTAFCFQMLEASPNIEIIILTINIIILYSLIDDLSVYEIDAFEIGRDDYH